MELTKEIIDLVCELETIVGNECFNPNSYNGYTGEDGCAFRYPVHWKDKDGHRCSTKDEITEEEVEEIHTIHYKFGSNHLYIGTAIKKSFSIWKKGVIWISMSC